MITLKGVALSISSSKAARRRMARSMGFNLSRGHSGAAEGYDWIDFGKLIPDLSDCRTGPVLKRSGKEACISSSLFVSGIRGGFH